MAPRADSASGGAHRNRSRPPASASAARAAASAPLGAPGAPPSAALETCRRCPHAAAPAAALGRTISGRAAAAAAHSTCVRDRMRRDPHTSTSGARCAGSRLPTGSSPSVRGAASSRGAPASARARSRPAAPAHTNLRPRRATPPAAAASACRSPSFAASATTRSTAPRAAAAISRRLGRAGRCAARHPGHWRRTMSLTAEPPAAPGAGGISSR